MVFHVAQNVFTNNLNKSLLLLHNVLQYKRGANMTEIHKKFKKSIDLINLQDVEFEQFIDNYFKSVRIAELAKDNLTKMFNEGCDKYGRVVFDHALSNEIAKRQ